MGNKLDSLTLEFCMTLEVDIMQERRCRGWVGNSGALKRIYISGRKTQPLYAVPIEAVHEKRIGTWMLCDDAVEMT